MKRWSFFAGFASFTGLAVLVAVLWSLYFVPQAPITEIRAAIDIGSGSTNIKVAEVDKRSRAITVLFADSQQVSYQEALERSLDSVFDDNTKERGYAVIKEYKEVADRYGAKKVVAVATAAFRKAENGQEFADKIARELDVDIRIIDQHMEGVLGFQGVVGKYPRREEAAVVWDIGGGSLQFSMKNDDDHDAYLVYRGHRASVAFKNLIIETIQGKSLNQTDSPNPISQSDMQEALVFARSFVQELPEGVREKIRQDDTLVHGIGSVFNYLIHPLVGKAWFTRKELLAAVYPRLGKTDEEFGGGPFANLAVSNCLLVLGIMQELDIREMEVVDVNNTDATLVYPEFWEKLIKAE